MNRLCAWTVGLGFTLAASLGAAAPPTELFTLGVAPADSVLSYRTPAGRYVGFHVAVCERIAQAHARASGQPQTLVHEEASGEAAVTRVASGELKLHCGATTNTPDAQEQVDFLPTTLVRENRLAVQAASPITTTDGLEGRRIAAIAGSHAAQALRRVLYQEHVNASIVKVTTLSDVLDLLARGEVEAGLVETDVAVTKLMHAHTTPPLSLRFIGPEVFREPLGIMVSRQPGLLRELAYRHVMDMMASGEMAELHREWFERPIAAPLRQLDLPASAATQRMWERPNPQPLFPKNQY